MSVMLASLEPPAIKVCDSIKVLLCMHALDFSTITDDPSHIVIISFLIILCSYCG